MSQQPHICLSPQQVEERVMPCGEPAQVRVAALSETRHL